MSSLHRYVQPFVYPVFDPIAERLIAEMAGAVTIARHIKLPNGIDDSQIVAATQDAAELYGFPAPRDLVGKLISQITDAYDILISRLVAWARYCDHPEAPKIYPIRILTHPDKQPLWVEKEVRQDTLDGVTIYWITTLKKLDQDGTYVLPSFADADELIRAYAIQNLVRPPHIAAPAEAESVIQSILSSVRELDVSKLHNIKVDVSKSSLKIPARKGKMFAITQGKLAQIPGILEAYRHKHGHALIIATGTVSIDAVLAMYEQACFEGKLLCLRCLNLWRPYGDPVLCSQCNQPWNKPYIYKPYGPRKRAR